MRQRRTFGQTRDRRNALLEWRMGVVRISVAAGQLCLQIFVHLFGDMSRSYELIKSVRKRRQEAGVEDWRALTAPVIIECRCDPVDAAQAVHERPRTHCARSQLVGDELLPARYGVGHAQEYLSVPPERRL